MTRTPVTVVAALQPLPLTVSGITLLPLTVGHCLLLDRLGVDIWAKEWRDDETAVALFVLSRPQSESCAIMAKNRTDFDNAVVTNYSTTANVDNEYLTLFILSHCRSAFSAFASLDPPRIGSTTSESFEPLGSCQDGNGLGWLLNIVIDYQVRAHCWDWRALLDLPIATAFVLSTADKVSEGWTWRQPSFVAMDRIDAEERAQREAANG